MHLLCCVIKCVPSIICPLSHQGSKNGLWTGISRIIISWINIILWLFAKEKGASYLAAPMLPFLIIVRLGPYCRFLMNVFTIFVGIERMGYRKGLVMHKEMSDMPRHLFIFKMSQLQNNFKMVAPQAFWSFCWSDPWEFLQLFRGTQTQLI